MSLLEEGRYQEQTLRQPEKAVVTYRKVIELPSASQAVRAEAHLQLGLCLQRMGRTDEARKELELVVDRFADQPRVADRAKQRLAVISAGDPAMLMPTDTKIYVELVRPGIKVGRFIASLKGLDEAGLDRLLSRYGVNQTLKSIRALLSEAMREDLSRIDSLALGIISQEELPGDTDYKFLLVLNPGKSVTARSFLALMAQSTGKSVRAHGDARLWRIPDGDNGDAGAMVFANLPNRQGMTGVMLLGKDRQVVCDAIDRWRAGTEAKGLACLPEFRRQAAARRRDSAILVYADVPAILAKVKQVMAPGDLARYEAGRQLFALETVKRGMARAALLDDGVLFEMSLMFNDRPNPFYKMLQTPQADRSLLGFVPTDSAATFLMSMGKGRAKWKQISAFFGQLPRIRQALGGSDPLAIVDGARNVESMTGLSVADDLLGNCRSLALIAPTVRPSSSSFTDSPAANLVVVLRTHRPDDFIRRLDETLLDQLRVGLETGDIDGVETRTYIDTQTGSGAAIRVARIKDVFLLTISEEMLRRVLSARRDGDVMERSSLGRSAVAAIPPSASKILLIRPELIINDVRTLRKQSALKLQPIRPVVAYTIERQNLAVLRVEIGQLTGLLNNAILAAGHATPSSAPTTGGKVIPIPVTTTAVSSPSAALLP